MRRSTSHANVSPRRSASLNLPAAWRDVSPRDAIFDRFEETLPQFFLFTLKWATPICKCASVTLRKVRMRSTELLELDPADRIGAKVLKDILVGVEHGDEP